MKRLLSIITLLILTACGTTGPLDLSKVNEPVPAGKARIVVTRDNSLLYLAAAVDVRVNGIKVASLGRGGSTIEDVPNGKNTISVSTPTAAGQFTVTFNAASKQTYNFEISPIAGNLMGGYGLGIAGDALKASVSEQSGYFQVGLKN